MSTLAMISRTLHAAHQKLSLPGATTRFRAVHHKIFADVRANPTFLERSGYAVWGAASFLQTQPLWRGMNSFVAHEKLLSCGAPLMRVAGGQAASALCLGAKLGAVFGAIACSTIAVPLALISTTVYTLFARRAFNALELQLDSFLEHNMHAQQLLNEKLFDIYREELFRLHSQKRISPLTLSDFLKLESSAISGNPAVFQGAIAHTGFWNYLSCEETKVVRAREAAVGAMVFQWHNEVAQVVVGQAAKRTPSSQICKQETARALVSRLRSRTQVHPTSLYPAQRKKGVLLANAQSSWVQERISPPFDSCLFDKRFGVALDLDTRALMGRGEAELRKRLDSDVY